MSQVSGDIYDRITRRGARVSRRGFTLYALKLLNPPRPRIVISQKVDKRAVVRNRLRRRIRAIIQRHAPTHRALVIITRKELLDLSFAELTQALAPILSSL